MAVTCESYHPTEHLILAKPRRQYRTGVRWHHWQLRSLIGSNGKHFVYFPVATGDRLVYVRQLNTTTGETEIVKRLPFTPRCLVANNGWVCCGGEKGAFSAFRVGEKAETEVDARLQLLNDRFPIPTYETGPEQEEIRLIRSIVRASADADKNIMAHTKTFGKDRVNCITLWFPPTLQEGCEGSYTEAVAVLANNDSTVMVVSLQDMEVLDEIKYPDFMNRAVISLDGRLLCAISDDPYLYVHKMKVKREVTTGVEPEHEWSQCAKIQLESQSMNDRSDNRGSFAACFSSTGKYLAVGTQYGTISVFNVAALDIPDANPLLTFFSTSRPNQDHGAVRDMAFSPGPIDLLAWTEDRGRVGVADIRTGFDSRQILYIDKDSDFEQVTIADRSTIDPRLLEPQGESTASDHLLSSFANTLDLGPEPQPPPARRPRPDVREALERYNIPLTAEETAVLEAIQDHRRRRDQLTADLIANARIYGPGTGNTGISNSGRAGSGSGSGSGSGGASERPGASGGATSTTRNSPWVERATRIASTTRSRTHSPGTINQPIERLANSSRMLQEQLEEMNRRAADSARPQQRGEQPQAMSATTRRMGNVLDSTMSNTAPPHPPERRRYAVNPFSRTVMTTSASNPASTSTATITAAATATATARAVGAGGAAAAAETGNREGLSLVSQLMAANAADPDSPVTGYNVEALYGPSLVVSVRNGTVSTNSDDTAVTNRLRRLRAAFLLREWEDSPTRRMFGYMTSHIRPEPYDTAGLTWSENGEILYVGAENGIYEFHVNRLARKLCPSIDLS